MSEDNRTPEQKANEAAIVADIMEKAAKREGDQAKLGDPDVGDVVAAPKRITGQMPQILWTPAMEARIRDCQALFIEALGRGYAQREQMHPDPKHPGRKTDEQILVIAIQTLKMNGYTHEECVTALLEKNGMRFHMNAQKGKTRIQ